MITKLSIQVIFNDRCIGPLLQKVLSHPSFLGLIEHFYVQVNIVEPGMREHFPGSEPLFGIQLQQTLRQVLRQLTN